MTWGKRWLAGVVLSGVVGGAFGAVAVKYLSPGLSEAEVRSIVDSSASSAGPAPDLDASIESFLMTNPQILELMAEKLRTERDTARRAALKSEIDAMGPVIADGGGAVAVGNPAGDVTLVEMYDYNCGFCRSTLPDIATLLAEDKDLRLVLRQFPILSQGSLDAAKVGLLVAKDGGDYWAFHRAMFTSRGQVDLETALAIAADLGIDRDAISARLADPVIEAAIAKSFDIARRLGIEGTPSFILADEVIPGAIGLDVLREKIMNVRSCGSTRCAS